MEFPGTARDRAAKKQSMLCFAKQRLCNGLQIGAINMRGRARPAPISGPQGPSRWLLSSTEMKIMVREVFDQKFEGVDQILQVAVKISHGHLSYKTLYY